MEIRLRAKKLTEVYGVGYAETEDLFAREPLQIPWEVRESMSQRNAFLDKINEDVEPH